MTRARGTVLLVLALLAALLAPAGAEPPPLTSWPYETGYVPMPDGTDLRYTVFLPDTGPGPWPVLLQYDGYAAGTNPYENGQDAFGARMRAKGYAILGVNVRGTGCSEGTFDVFEHQAAVDGYEVVEWAARQPWSNGSVGMFGVSMPAIMSLYVAALDPPHLSAIAPAAALTDLYRDVAYPGGIFNATFPTVWTAAQKSTGYQDTALVVAQDRDPRCVPDTTSHAMPDRVTAVQVAREPYDTGFFTRSLGDRIADIDVPVLSQTAWQDEQVSGRIASALRALHSATSFHVLTNGSHGVSVTGTAFADLEEDFFDRYVGGVANGFETATPHVQVWHELQAPAYVPRWVTGYATWPTPAATTFHLTADGRLTPSAPLAAGRVPYAYPAPARSAVSAGSDTETATYKAPGYGVAFTTDPFAGDVEVLGSASVDLWLSSTATDTDLQVTLSEVRPDGQETYVQRGWLRASHRALDAVRSTALLPYHPHTAAARAPLAPGVPTLLRAEVFPSGHVFRAGSRLRLTVEAPLSATGLRGFQVVPYPAVDTVHTGGTTPSRLVVGTVPATGVVAAYPACDTLVNQPCRG
jgi:putative CocE/NonD family hydrolase